jgi:hypothetical protein
MTVQELITQLQQLDPNLRVFRDGFEGGYDEVTQISSVLEIALDVNDTPFFGNHEWKEDLDQEQLEGKTIVKGVII